MRGAELRRIGDIMTERLLSFHYTLRDAAGQVLDTSRGAQPIDCIEGADQIVEGLEKVLCVMTAGEQRKVVVPPEQGYGDVDADLVQRVPRGALPVEELSVGDQFQTGPDRHAPIVRVQAIEGDEVVLDANHPLAGQSLYFEVELVAARPATKDELSAARGNMS